MFSVKSCRNVHILLGSVPGDVFRDAYEITLGYEQNTASYIKLDVEGTDKVEVPTPDLLNCSSYVTLWVSWGSGVISVGRGPEVGRNVFLGAIDPQPKPVVQFYYTTGDDAIGYWDFINTDGSYIIEFLYLF